MPNYKDLPLLQLSVAGMFFQIGSFDTLQISNFRDLLDSPFLLHTKKLTLY